MITEEELQSIHTSLLNAKNPLFLFDDDTDGLCAFLILWRLTKKGKGIAIKGQFTEKSIASLSKQRADLIIILDKPTLEQQYLTFFHCPVIHIDHHPPLPIAAPNYYYYNPRKNNPSDNRPTSYWAYQVTKQDLWISMIGTIGDWYIPENLSEFQKKFPGLLPEAHHPGQVLFETDFGILVRCFAFSLKGKKQETKQCIKVLSRIENPWEILRQETPQGKFIWKHYLQLNKNYQKVLSEALQEEAKDSILLYTYPGSQDSFTSLLSNELIYKHPDKIIIVGRIKEGKILLSLRSTTVNLPEIIVKALEDLHGTGGGHEHACGANMNVEEFPLFLSRIKKYSATEKK